MRWDHQGGGWLEPKKLFAYSFQVCAVDRRSFQLPADRLELVDD